jgi:hypothetical protein
MSEPKEHDYYNHPGLYDLTHDKSGKFVEPTEAQYYNMIFYKRPVKPFYAENKDERQRKGKRPKTI